MAGNLPEVYRHVYDLCKLAHTVNGDIKKNIGRYAGEQICKLSIEMTKAVTMAYSVKDYSVKSELMSSLCEKICEIRIYIRLIYDFRVVTAKRHSALVDTLGIITEQIDRWSSYIAKKIK